MSNTIITKDSTTGKIIGWRTLAAGEDAATVIAALQAGNPGTTSHTVATAELNTALAAVNNNLDHITHDPNSGQLHPDTASEERDRTQRAAAARRIRDSIGTGTAAATAKHRVMYLLLQKAAGTITEAEQAELATTAANWRIANNI